MRTITKDSRGWTLMEMVVVLAVIAILAAILTPIITSYVDRARMSTSAQDVKSIAAAIIQFNTDTRIWPIYSGTFSSLTGPNYTILRTPGNDAIVGGGVGAWDPPAGPTGSGDMNEALNFNSMGISTSGRFAWKGAYLELGPDPWGSRYYLTADNLKPISTNAAFVLSPGPNQTIETQLNQARASTVVIGGDDIVQRIR